MVLYKDGHYSYPNGEFPDPPFTKEEVFAQDDGRILIIPEPWRAIDDYMVEPYLMGFYVDMPDYYSFCP